LETRFLGKVVPNTALHLDGIIIRGYREKVFGGYIHRKRKTTRGTIPDPESLTL